jgi:hypothetical protein
VGNLFFITGVLGVTHGQLRLTDKLNVLKYVLSIFRQNSALTKQFMTTSAAGTVY